MPGSQGLTGYGIPLGTAHELEDVLAKVFPHYRMLDESGTGLSGSIGEAHDDTRIRQAALAVRADMGKGVAVSWPGHDPDAPLRAGSTVRMCLTATTGPLPVRVGHLRLRGVPDGVRFSTALPAAVELPPGGSKDVLLTLAEVTEHRDGLFDSTDGTTWHWSLDGTVTSPLTRPVSQYLGGLRTGLEGGPTGKPLTVTGTVVTSASPGGWAFIAGVVLLSGGLVACVLLRSYRSLGGLLTAEAVDRSTPLRIPLQGRTVTQDLSSLIGASGTIRVKGLPGPRGKEPRLLIRCSIADRTPSKAVCHPGNSVLLSGIEFRYEPDRP